MSTDQRLAVAWPHSFVEGQVFKVGGQLFKITFVGLESFRYRRLRWYEAIWWRITHL